MKMVSTILKSDVGYLLLNQLGQQPHDIQSESIR